MSKNIRNTHTSPEASVDTVHKRTQERELENSNKGAAAIMQGDPSIPEGKRVAGSQARILETLQAQKAKKKKQDEFYLMLCLLTANSPAEQKLIDHIHSVTETADKLAVFSEKLGNYDDLAVQADTIQDLQNQINTNGGKIDQALRDQARRQIEAARKKLGLDGAEINATTDILLMRTLTETKINLNKRAQFINDVNEAERQLRTHAQKLKDDLEHIQDDQELTQNQKDARCRELIEKSEKAIVDITEEIANHPEVKRILCEMHDLNQKDTNIQDQTAEAAPDASEEEKLEIADLATSFSNMPSI